jgi:hypothetical protein
LSLPEVFKVSVKEGQTMERMVLFDVVCKIAEKYRKLSSNPLKKWHYFGFDLA